MLHEETLSQSVLRPTYISVDLGALTGNVRAIEEKASGSRVMYILKANAYGHGLLKVAAHLESLNADYFGVAYLEEGIMLREAGIKTPILIMGGISGLQIPLFIKHDLTITASSVDKLTHIESVAKAMGRRAKAHLKIDTGMERIGIHHYSARKLIAAAALCEHTEIEGIFSHFANADEEIPSFTELQIERFSKVLSIYKELKLDLPRHIHISNSGGVLQYTFAPANMIRVGILLYGVYPALHLRSLIDVRPVLSWRTSVVYFKVVRPGSPVSYGGNWSSVKMTRIVTIPVGYGDGYMRSMSNKCKVLIRGVKYPSVGAICMDQTMINIGEGTAYNGDEVILIGQEGEEAITVENLAEWAGTIPYEIMTNINTRVPRIYVDSSTNPYIS